MTDILTLYPEHMFGGPRVDGMPARIRYSFQAIEWCEVHDCQIPVSVDGNPDERCWFDFRYAVFDSQGDRFAGEACETTMRWLEMKPPRKEDSSDGSITRG